MLQMSHVAWSVCVLVTRMYLAKTAEPIEMSFVWLTRVGSRNYVIGGVEIPHGNGKFLVGEFSGSLKSIGSLCCGVRSKGNHSIVNNGMTADYDVPDW